MGSHPVRDLPASIRLVRGGSPLHLLSVRRTPTPGQSRTRSGRGGASRARERNPSPSVPMTVSLPPPRVVLSQNCRGLKSANRLDHCIAALSRKNADVILIQELGLHPEDKSRFTRICRRYGYLGFAAFLPTTRTHGGAAVLIKWASFGLGPTQALVHKTFLGAGAVTVQLPPQRG